MIRGNVYVGWIIIDVEKIGPYMCLCMFAGHRNGHLTCICNAMCLNRERTNDSSKRLNEWDRERLIETARVPFKKNDIASAPKMRQKSNRMCEKWEKIMTHFSFSISLLFPLHSSPFFLGVFFSLRETLDPFHICCFSHLAIVLLLWKKLLADKNVCFRFIFVSYFMPFSYRTAQVWHFTRNHCFLLSLSIRYLHK